MRCDALGLDNDKPQEENHEQERQGQWTGDLRRSRT